jgi:hypothetical protein
MWLCKGQLYAETEGFAIAIQDQVINTKNYLKHVIEDNSVINDKCRRCKNQQETTEHITSGCSLLAPTEYTHRHNNICKQLHLAICKKHQLTEITDPWYTYKPQTIIENDEIKLYWNRDILTDRTIAHNRPDITLINKVKKSVYLIDVAIPNTPNLEKKYNKKIQNYLPLAEEIKSVWKLNSVIIVPIIISATGVIPKNLHQSIATLHLDPNIYILLQKTIVINTTTIVRRFLNN